MVLIRRQLPRPTSTHPLCPYTTLFRSHGLLVRFFDVLHVDGTDLIDLPLAKRQVKLDALVGDLAVPRVVTADPSEAQALFDDAIAQGHEGAVVKAID